EVEGGRALGPLREVPRGGRTHAHARPPRRQGAKEVTLVGLALAGAVKARARELGFDRVAIGPAGPPEHGPAFERWLAAGHAATMDYLARGREDRLDPDRLLPGCRSVVAVALVYARDDDDPSWTPVARYARGRDYHDVMRPRWHLYGVSRRVPDPGLRRTVCPRRAAVHRLPHDRAPRRHPRGVPGSDRGVGVRVRRLPGRLPLEPEGRAGARAGVRTCGPA